jgi:hypothetical protein
MSFHLLLELGFRFYFPQSEATPVLEEFKWRAK